jgi:ribosomal protein L29
MTEPKLAKNMTAEEYAATLAELRRGPPVEPLALPQKHARDLSEQERAEWLSNYKRSLQQ